MIRSRWRGDRTVAKNEDWKDEISVLVNCKHINKIYGTKTALFA